MTLNERGAARGPRMKPLHIPDQVYAAVADDLLSHLIEWIDDQKDGASPALSSGEVRMKAVRIRGRYRKVLAEAEPGRQGRLAAAAQLAAGRRHRSRAR